jgi:hypothetical protein
LTWTSRSARGREVRSEVICPSGLVPELRRGPDRARQPRHLPTRAEAEGPGTWLVGCFHWDDSVPHAAFDTREHGPYDYAGRGRRLSNGGRRLGPYRPGVGLRTVCDPRPRRVLDVRGSTPRPRKDQTMIRTALRYRAEGVIRSRGPQRATAALADRSSRPLENRARSSRAARRPRRKIG